MKVVEATRIRIKQLCKERGITVNKLCTMSGITHSTVKSFLNGDSKNTSIVTIKILCDGLDISLKEFFDCILFDELLQEIE